MKNEILQLISTNPRGYVAIIKRNPVLLEWVELSAKGSVKDSLLTKIYSAVNNVDTTCPHGNNKKVRRFSLGLSNCAHANACKCNQESISSNVSATKSNFSEADNEAINAKRERTMLKKYRVAFNSQREDLKHIWQRPKIPLEIHALLNDEQWLNTEYNIKQRSLSEIADELSVYYGTVGWYCTRFGFAIRPSSRRSREEIQLQAYIEELGFSTLSSDRAIISPKELDVVVPERRLAFELNGLLWHSYHPKNEYPEAQDRRRHRAKTTSASEAGYQLFHITDYEWRYKQDIVKSIIASQLGLNTTIAARKTIIKDVVREDEEQFLNQYHIQGYVRSERCLGLYHDDALVMLMSVGKSRFNKKADLELLRLCSVTGVTVVGGLSKLLAHLRTIYPNQVLVSYCDLSKGTGRGYDQAGFSLIGVTEPGYIWTDGNSVISRFKTRKKELQKWLSCYDGALSEAQNMFNGGFRRYWDCGNNVYQITL
jgi:hypothetical protein